MCDFGIGETAAAGTAAAAAASTAAEVTAIAAVASVAVTAAGAAMSAYSSYQEADAANKAAEYNANVANDQAQQAQQVGQVEAEEHDDQVKALIGQQSAGYGAGGVDPDSGSPLTVKTQTAGYGALDSLAIKQQAANQSWGYTNEATLDYAKEVNPYGVAGTSLLTGASQVGGSLLTASRAGVFS